ncbi:tetratricopeptide repeat protein 23 [Denticeps clupeoides]|uniref:Tetratricopeptide repeat protein 23-like n=1 Tax=Denticeps clupeoides TaxID=299321 RepID=A0AAY4BLC2_9TELE|nr:tetratricopeptide repeat protein 23 [Denticeps clupeoides]
MNTEVGNVSEISVCEEMLGPEEKLSECSSRVQALADDQQFDECLKEMVRCVALTRLVYGDKDLRLAQGHTRLAEAYLRFKGWAAQAHDHASTAQQLLSSCCSSTSQMEDRVSVLTTRLSLFQTQGGAALLLGNLAEAESSLRKAEGLIADLRELGRMSQEECLEAELVIRSGLSRVYQRQGQAEEALAQCERALELLERAGKEDKLCAVYTDMAAIHQAKGFLDKAIVSLQQAHAFALSQGPGGLEGAHVAHSLALACSSAADPHHNDSAAHYFEESLSAYRTVVGAQDAKTLAVQDDYCRFLLQTNQHERCVEIQKESLPLKRNTFGDLSAEVADTLQLIGGVEMTQGLMKQSHKTMKKCLEVCSLLYGPQHKKTRTTQKTVDMLSQVPEVSETQRKGSSLQTRPRFSAVVPSHTTKPAEEYLSESQQSFTLGLN